MAGSVVRWRDVHGGLRNRQQLRQVPGLGAKTFEQCAGFLINDLRQGMVLEGTVTNVAAFGAFVDIGVHQDGLVHVSQLSDKFVTDAREVVKTGAIVTVKVLEVDLPRKRIGLTMKLGQTVALGDVSGENRFEGASKSQRPVGRPREDAAVSTAMASAFLRLARKGVRRYLFS